MSRRGLAILMFISMSVSTLNAQSSISWARRLDSGDGPETVTILQFYFHDIPSGKNPTAVQVVKPAAASSVGTSSNSFFGSVWMVDDPLTEAGDASSKLVGRAQGMYGFDSKSDFTLLMAMSFGFADGPYNGSSLSIMGGNPTMNTNRELPVLGGTGLFRMARGYALMKTVSLNASSGDAVVHYNVTVHAPASNADAQISSSGGTGGGGATPAVTRTLSSSSSPMIIPGNRWMVAAVMAFLGFVCLIM